MALMDEVTSGSPQHMDSIVEQFRNLSLSNYPGENVRLLVNDVQATYNLLKHGNAMPATISSVVIAKFLCCSVEEFRTPFYSKSVQVDDDERSLLGKDIGTILAFQSTSLVVKSLCKLAMSSFKRLVDYDRWPPLKTVPKLQSDALPNAYQAAVVEELKLLRRNLGSIKDSPDIFCHKCGKKGHIKPNFPENDMPGGEFKKKDSGPERMNSKRFWKDIPPTDGSLNTINRDGKTWHWCAKCRGGDGRWSTTHSTATHTGSQPVKNQGAVAGLAHAVLNVDDAPEEDATLVFPLLDMLLPVVKRM